jgi:spermidine synthase
MLRTEKLGEAAAPDGSVLTLYRHGRDYYIRVGTVELMSTRRIHSEERLAEVCCEALRDAAGARVLIGGLGFGFTLKAALRLLPEDARVVVAELIPEVVEWNRAYPLAGDALDDPRAEVRLADVAEVLRENPRAFDAILMDVDNGAEVFTDGGNASLYRSRGVRAAAAALRPGGRLAYWSADDDPGFAEVVRRAGLEVEVVRARAHATSGAWHSIIVGRRAGAGRREPLPTRSQGK